LSETVIAQALNTGSNQLVLGALAALSKVPVKVANKIVESQSAKGILGLVWKAGLSCAFAVQIQTKLGHIAPEQAVKPKPDGAYPMSDEELDWQLELFTG